MIAGINIYHIAFKKQRELLCAVPVFGVTLLSHRWSLRRSYNNNVPAVTLIYRNFMRLS
jgi:hypothetical protein